VSHEFEHQRRRFLRLLLTAPVAFAGLRLLGPEDLALADDLAAARGPLAATPECDDGDEPTPPETEGPFFKPRSPRRLSLLELDMAGTRLVLTGRVFSRNCRPLGGALLDFWHADAGGEYDNEGYRLRGHQFTDREGRYRLETVVPGRYPGRTPHIHVKVQVPRGRVLTTQLYFPGEPRNERDGLFRPELLTTITQARDGKVGRFHFVLGQS
jgi:protocatechuate 3,4-dioxygenase beta subunit